MAPWYCNWSRHRLPTLADTFRRLDDPFFFFFVWMASDGSRSCLPESATGMTGELGDCEDGKIFIWGRNRNCSEVWPEVSPIMDGLYIGAIKEWLIQLPIRVVWRGYELNEVRGGIGVVCPNSCISLEVGVPWIEEIRLELIELGHNKPINY